MKANLKKMLGLSALCLTMFSNTMPTWAGNVSTPEVSLHFNQAGNSAGGTMAGARYSADNTQFIGCSVDGRSTGSSVFCSARDRAGSQLSCFAYDRATVRAVAGMNDSSYIYFTLNPNVHHGYCKFITIYNSTQNIK